MSPVKKEPHSRPIATVKPLPQVFNRETTPPPKNPQLIHGAAMIEGRNLTKMILSSLKFFLKFTGKLMLLVKWHDVRLSTLEEASIMNLLCPQLVIEYYESCLVWDD